MKHLGQITSALALGTLLLTAIFLRPPQENTASSPQSNESSQQAYSGLLAPPTPSTSKPASRETAHLSLNAPPLPPQHKKPPLPRESYWREAIKTTTQSTPSVQTPKLLTDASLASAPQNNNPPPMQALIDNGHLHASLLPDFFSNDKQKPSKAKLSGKLITDEEDEIVGAKVSVSLPTQH